MTNAEPEFASANAVDAAIIAQAGASGAANKAPQVWLDAATTVTAHLAWLPNAWTTDHVLLVLDELPDLPVAEHRALGGLIKAWCGHGYIARDRFVGWSASVRVESHLRPKAVWVGLAGAFPTVEFDQALSDLCVAVCKRVTAEQAKKQGYT